MEKTRFCDWEMELGELVSYHQQESGTKSTYKATIQKHTLRDGARVYFADIYIVGDDESGDQLVCSYPTETLRDALEVIEMQGGERTIFNI